jgi:hypothetical protein
MFLSFDIAKVRAIFQCCNTIILPIPIQIPESDYLSDTDSDSSLFALKKALIN